MNYLAIAIVALFGLIAVAPSANAVVCARGVYRAGCVGPYGGVVVRHPYHPYAYHPYAYRPYGYRYGVRVYR